MQNPAETTIMSIYGDDDALSAIKMITLAPEMGNAQELIMDLTQREIVVSLGHTAADYDTGIRVLGAGARMLTHVFKAMNAFSHRSPGVVCTFGRLESIYIAIRSVRYSEQKSGIFALQSTPANLRVSTVEPLKKMLTLYKLD